MLHYRPIDPATLPRLEKYATMTAASIKTTALGLCSGGLDSILSALVLRRQGIRVHWVSFETPFFSAARARRAAAQTGIPLTVRDIGERYLPMLKNPNCGYGQHMNPCMDCHALMFCLAGGIMRAKGFDFLFSGEVLGQRPMSQTRPSLRYVEKHSGCEGYILRPLSARLLPETIVEQKGLVDRTQLLDISGRSRKRQIALAAQFGVTDYPNPAGGCLLTDAGYCRRLKDLFDHQQDYTQNDLHLLKYGRHFRLKDHTRVIVGRTRNDNEMIHRHADGRRHLLLKMEDYPGPTVLLPADAAQGALFMGAAMCAGYSRAPSDTPVRVRVSAGKDRRTLTVVAVLPAEVKHLMI